MLVGFGSFVGWPMSEFPCPIFSVVLHFSGRFGGSMAGVRWDASHVRASFEDPCVLPHFGVREECLAFLADVGVERSTWSGMPRMLGRFWDSMVKVRSQRPMFVDMPRMFGICRGSLGNSWLGCRVVAPLPAGCARSLGFLGCFGLLSWPFWVAGSASSWAAAFLGCLVAGLPN